MKLYVKASESNSEPSSETIIRMTLSNSARDRGFTRSNDMLKLHFFGIDKETSLIIAAALQSIAWDKDISDYDSNISQEDIDSLMSIAAKLGVTSGQSAISYLDNNDTGSGEPIVFSIRYNNKLIYSSGLHESEWGKMGSGFSNDDDSVRLKADYARYYKTVIDGMNKISPNILKIKKEDYFDKDRICFYLPIACDNGAPYCQLGNVNSEERYIKDNIDPRYADTSSNASYILSQARKRAQAVSSLKLEKVSIDSISNVPVFRFSSYDFGDVICIPPTKSALRFAKDNDELYVYVETKYLK